MRSVRGRMARTLTTAALSLLVTACAGVGPPSAATGASRQGDSEPQAAGGARRITIGINGTPLTLNNSLNSAGGGNQAGGATLQALVHAGLAHQDPQGNWQPQLAEAVPSLENGLWKILPDGRMQTTWKIKSGATWHDRIPLTADDLVFTMAVGQDKDIVQFQDSVYAGIENVSAPDPSTVVVAWKQPYILAETMFTARLAVPLPRHLLNSEFTTDKANFTNQPYWTTAYVGAGPFKLREFNAGSSVVMEAYDHYVLGRPRIDQIEVKFVPDPNVLIANTLADAIEVGLELRGVSFDQMMQVKNNWRNGTAQFDQTFSGYLGIFPNLDDPNPAVIGDVRFRRALLHATNRKQLAEVLAGGLVPYGDSYLSPNDPDYPGTASSIVSYEHDPRKAMQLIEDLGYTKSADGFYRANSSRRPDPSRREPAGQRLTVEYRTPAGDDIRLKTQPAVADDWQRVGVGVDQVAIPQQQAQDKLYRATFPAFDMVQQSGDLRGLKSFYSVEALSATNIYGKGRSRLKSAELDGLLDRVYLTIPRTERQQALGQAIYFLTDQVILLQLFRSAAPTFISNRVQNVGPTQSTWNAEQWTLS